MDLRACILLKKNKDIRVFIRMWDNFVFEEWCERDGRTYNEKEEILIKRKSKTFKLCFSLVVRVMKKKKKKIDK